jgi:sarcosine oxidase delta subunit
MKRTLSLLSATALIALSSVAYANDAVVKSEFEATKNGGYEAVRDVERRAADGAKQHINEKINVKVDSKGNSVKEFKHKETTDRGGWFNKEKNNVTSEVKKNADGTMDRVVEKTHIDPKGTNVKTKTDTQVKTDGRGNMETTTEIKKTTDPKGLFNKHTETSRVKMHNNKVIERTVE